MAGLRERQKADRREALLAAAMHLFEKNGFEQTTIQSIAERARLTVPTVYRYYRSKTQLLLGLHDRLYDQVELDGERVLAAVPKDPVKAITALLIAHIDLAGPRSDSNLRLWRTITAEMIRQPQYFAPTNVAHEQRLLRQLKRLCASLRERKQLRANLSADDAAELLNVVGRGAFRMMIGGERSDGQVRALMETCARRIHQGFRK
jgi:AcrR family transcriptional regulator